MLNCTLIWYNSWVECSVVSQNTSHMIPFQHKQHSNALHIVLGNVLILLVSVQYPCLHCCHFNWHMGGVVLICKHDSQHDSNNTTTGAGAETLTHLNATEHHHHLQITWQPGSVTSFRNHGNISVPMCGVCWCHPTWFYQPQSGRYILCWNYWVDAWCLHFLASQVVSCAKSTT